MAKHRAQHEEYRTFSEYREAFFPEAEKKRLEKNKQHRVGEEIAAAALEQAKKELTTAKKRT